MRNVLARIQLASNEVQVAILLGLTSPTLQKRSAYVDTIYRIEPRGEYSKQDNVFVACIATVYTVYIKNNSTVDIQRLEPRLWLLSGHLKILAWAVTHAPFLLFLHSSPVRCILE